MLKTLLLVLAGLVAGLAIAFWLLPGATVPSAAADAPSTAASNDTYARAQDARVSAARIAALEAALAAEAEQRVALEARVAELAADLETLGDRERRTARSGDAANGAPPRAGVERMRERFERDASSTAEQREQRSIERLVAAGFAPDRAQWINRRMQELRMQALQAQYEARRDGRPQPPDLGPTALRAELGDADYERFLVAQGRSTSVPIGGVLASSPAERAGMQPGDEIVAYNGQRVFDIAELNELTLGGAAGESVVVDVRRNGQSLQLVLPRGPLGIWGPLNGPPVRLER